jgi:L-threonylcarbamoyladenylate synthase
MKLLDTTHSNITEAAEVIRIGGLVAFPTETVYGLGADGLNPVAAAKIFEAKKRPTFNPLILHIANKDWLKRFSIYDDERINRLVEIFWPGPLTLVLPKTDLVPDIITSGNPTVAVRMPNHKVALELIEKSDVPIAAPSANKFGHLSPTTAQHVVKSLGNKVDIILDGGKCSVGVESTILELQDSEIYMLRPGGLSKEKIEKEIGKIKSGRTNPNKPNAPGQLPFHYAPSIPLDFLSEENLKKYSDKKIGALFFEEIKDKANFENIKILSSSGNMNEAAANLFRFLHEFEKESLDLILVEPVKEEGLGVAIMDRLKKAAAKYQS